jgi:hypothetical protein
MIAIIKQHNRLNGIPFSIAEFAVIALIVGAYATYYAIHYEVALALIGWGITANCLTVIVIGIRMLIDRTEPKNRIAPFWKKDARQQHLRDNPHMLRDTLALTTAMLLPFLALVLVLYQGTRSRKRGDR